MSQANEPNISSDMSDDDELDELVGKTDKEMMAIDQKKEWWKLHEYIRITRYVIHLYKAWKKGRY